MLKLLMSFWHKNIGSSYDKGLFYILFSFVYIMIALIFTFIYGMFVNDNNLIGIIILSALFIQYNAPEMVVEIQQYKNIHYVVDKLALYKYITFQVIKKNILISIFIITNVILGIFFIGNIQKIIIIILSLVIQINLLLLRVFSKEHKINICVFLLCYICGYILFKNNWIFIPIIIINIILIVKTSYFQFKSFILKNDVYNEKKISMDSKMTSIVSLKIYFRRLKIKEYTQLIIQSLIIILIYRNLGTEYVQYFIIIFFIAELELYLDTRNVNFERNYSKYIFTKLANISKFELLVNTIEFRLGIMYTVIILIFFIYDITNSGFYMHKILFFLNILSLIWIFIIKYLTVYYNCLKCRIKFKSTGFKITMLYIMIIFLSPNMFKDIIIKLGQYFEIYGEIFKSVLILLCFVLKFENLFFKLKNEENQVR